MPDLERLTLLENEYSRAALDLARRFVQRWDIHCEQIPDGRYVLRTILLNAGHLMDHLEGSITLGTYLLDAQSQARFIVLDADEEGKFGELVELARTLVGEGAPAYLEQSRSGGHLWLFFDKPVAGGPALAFGQGVLRAHKLEGVELFPKDESGVKLLVLCLPSCFICGSTGIDICSC